MDINHYNKEVDRMLQNVLSDKHFREEYCSLGEHFFLENDLGKIIDIIVNKIRQRDKGVSKKELRETVEFLIKQKYKKCYVYDPKSKYNKKELDKFPDKVVINSAEDLVSHRYDYTHDVFREDIYRKRSKNVFRIKKIPQFEQRSVEWFNQRNDCITATSVAIALDEDPYKFPADLLLEKCGRGTPFEENENVHHGKKYEKIGNMFYSFRNNVRVGEYGFLRNRKYPFIGASPDGICEKKTADSDRLSKLVGRLLEIKFPKIRKIVTQGKLDGDICPHYYYVQIQTQLFVTELDECDFLQCRVEEYDSWEDYVNDSYPNVPGLSKKTNLEKGCLIQLLPKKMVGGDPKKCLYQAKYIYPPKLHMTHQEIERWISHEILHFHQSELSENYLVDRVIYWRLVQVACHLIKADEKWFKSKISILKQFWDYVLFYRSNMEKLEKLVTFVRETGSKNSAEIFAKVHQDYLSINKDSTYEPLYQKESEWRRRYNEKYKK